MQYKFRKTFKKGKGKFRKTFKGGKGKANTINFKELSDLNKFTDPIGNTLNIGIEEKKLTISYKEEIVNINNYFKYWGEVLFKNKKGTFLCIYKNKQIQYLENKDIENQKNFMKENKDKIKENMDELQKTIENEDDKIVVYRDGIGEQIYNNHPSISRYTFDENTNHINNFCDDKPCGKGIIYYNNNTTYKGDIISDTNKQPSEPKIEPEPVVEQNPEPVIEQNPESVVEQKPPRQTIRKPTRQPTRITVRKTKRIPYPLKPYNITYPNILKE